MDVGLLFLPHTQAAKLIEPREHALHDPPPPVQSTAMLAAEHGKPRNDMSRSQPAPKGGRVDLSDDEIKAAVDYIAEQSR